MIQQYLSQLPPRTELIVLGDFNDFDQDLRDAGDNRPISKVKYSTTNSIRQCLF